MSSDGDSDSYINWTNTSYWPTVLSYWLTVSAFPWPDVTTMSTF